MDKKEWQREMDSLIVIASQIEAESERDPLFNFRPHPKQQAFIDAVLLEDFATEIWMLAANRSGKSDAGAYCGSTLARFGDPKVGGKATTGWVVSVDSNASRDIIEPKYFDNGFVPPEQTHPPFIPDSEILDWRKKDKILKLKNGSMIGFKSCESKGKKFPGVEKDWVHFDEPPEKSVYDEVGIRVGAGKKLRIFGTATILPPEGRIGAISWILSEIVKPMRAGKLPYVKLFGASIYDNPFISRSEIEKLEHRYPEGTPQNRIRLKGELIPGIAGARVYSPFDRNLHVKSDGKMTFYTKAPLCWTWDFNVEPMVSHVGQRYGNIFRVFREFVLDEGNIFEMVDEFKSVFPTHGAEVWVYGDATGKFRNEQTRKSNFNLILRAMENYPVPVRLKLPEKNPDVTDRINAVNTALKDENGVVRVEIHEECAELIQDLEEVLSDNKGGIRKTSDRKDPYCKRTHASDDFGYWIAQEAPAKKMSTFYTTKTRVEIPKVPRYAFN